ncbi:hypothetical protein [Microvirga ossetica]|nr:hypothetical protein [Microvirga ossetica]
MPATHAPAFKSEAPHQSLAVATSACQG